MSHFDRTAKALGYSLSTPTAGTLITPASGNRIRVVGANVADNTLGTIKLFFDSDTAANTVFKGRIAANTDTKMPSGISVDGPVDGVLKITSPGNAEGVIYYLEF